MDMKLKKSDINILIMLVGILIPVGVYALVFNNFQAKTAALNAENATLQTEVDYLQDLADHKKEYIEQTEMMQEEIVAIKDRFPAEYRPEDTILYAISVENDQEASIAAITISDKMIVDIPGAAPVGDPNAPVEGEEEVVQDAVMPEAVAPITLYANNVSITMDCSYESLKDVIRRLNEDPNRKSIESVSAVFDPETGVLASSMQYTAYSLEGTENEYSEPEIKGVKFGKKDIFNSGDKAAAVKEEKEAEEAAEKAEEKNED